MNRSNRCGNIHTFRIEVVCRMSGLSPVLGTILGGYSPSLGSFAPADFGAADDMQPPELALDPTGTGTLVPYSTIISNVLSRQMYEIKEKTPTSGINTILSWKRRLREFMGQKNEDLIEFLRKPLEQHPTLGRAIPFMKRFGRSDFLASHGTLQAVALDVSGPVLMPIFEQEMKRAGPSSFNELREQIKWIFETYRQAGEDCMRNENVLRTRLDNFDKIHQKLVLLLDMPSNEASPEMATSIEKYLEKNFHDNGIKEYYTDFIISYRRFITLREVILFLRTTELVDKEPLCSICLNEPICYALSPCGHTFCNNCSKRQMIQCYMCRTNIKERIRLYFG